MGIEKKFTQIQFQFTKVESKLKDNTKSGLEALRQEIKQLIKQKQRNKLMKQISKDEGGKKGAVSPGDHSTSQIVTPAGNQSFEAPRASEASDAPVTAEILVKLEDLFAQVKKGTDRITAVEFV